MDNIKKHSFKIQIATAVAVVLFVITTTAYFTQRVADIESRIRHLDGKTDLYTERYEQTILEQIQLQIDIAKIQTKLGSIESLLLEVKSDLKTHSY